MPNSEHDSGDERVAGHATPRDTTTHASAAQDNPEGVVETAISQLTELFERDATMNNPAAPHHDEEDLDEVASQASSMESNESTIEASIASMSSGPNLPRGPVNTPLATTLSMPVNPVDVSTILLGTAALPIPYHYVQTSVNRSDLVGTTVFDSEDASPVASVTGNRTHISGAARTSRDKATDGDKPTDGDKATDGDKPTNGDKATDGDSAPSPLHPAAAPASPNASPPDKASSLDVKVVNVGHNRHVARLSTSSAAFAPARPPTSSPLTRSTLANVPRQVPLSTTDPLASRPVPNNDPTPAPPATSVFSLPEPDRHLEAMTPAQRAFEHQTWLETVHEDLYRSLLRLKQLATDKEAIHASRFPDAIEAKSAKVFFDEDLALLLRQADQAPVLPTRYPEEVRVGWNHNVWLEHTAASLAQQGEGSRGQDEGQ